jgi:putative endonuclease
MTKKDLGNKGENAVCSYLQKYGYSILERNYSCPKGEIDIIAHNSDTIAFIEVKARKENSMVSGAEAVNYTKKLRIIKTAAWYSYANPLTKQPRFDIAEVILKNDVPSSIRYYKAAFDMTGSTVMLSFK